MYDEATGRKDSIDSKKMHNLVVNSCSSHVNN